MASMSTSTSSAGASSSSACPTPSPVTRPVTSKARGVCIYYKDPRGCYAKDKCKFLHSEPPKEDDPPVITPYDASKTCKFYLQGYCKRGDSCWFQHTDSMDKGKSPHTLEEEDDFCSICFEKPTTYGLLAGCSHVFCTTCIMQWRDPSNKPISTVGPGNTKRCPMCRQPSRFITPSSKFWRDGSDEKLKTIESYRQSMTRVQCRYFQKSLAKDKNRPACPYGKDCFYQHKKEDGTLHEFQDGVEVSIRRYHSSRRSRFTYDDLRMFDLEGFDAAIGFNLPLFDGINFNLHRTTANANGTPATQRPDPFTREGLLSTTFEALRTHVAQHVTATPNRSQGGRPANDNGGPAARNGNNRAAGGSDTSRQTRTGVPRSQGPQGDMFGLMQLLDMVREQLDIQPTGPPAAPTAGTSGPGASTAGNRARTTTRHGTAAVSDADTDSDDDEPPPPLIPVSSTGAGYDSDASMPALQVVSDSSGEEDSGGARDDDTSEGGASGAGDDEDEDQWFDEGTFNPELFFRDLFGVPPDELRPELRPRSHGQGATDARPNASASARFSTVVDRSASGGSGAAGASASDSANGHSPESPPIETADAIRLMEWANAVLSMDQEPDSADDDEPMPPLEPVPGFTAPSTSTSTPTTAAAAASTSSNPARNEAPLQQTQPQHHGAVADNPSAALPLMESSTPGHGLLPTSRSSPSTAQVETEPVRESAPPPLNSHKAERKASSTSSAQQQEFTTDGRGRVISIGGRPEPSAPATAPVLIAEVPVSDYLESHSGAASGTSAEPLREEELVEGEGAPHVPGPVVVAVERKSSEFTTDGRGRVISVGHSVSSGSSGVGAAASTSGVGDNEMDPELGPGGRQETTSERDGEGGGRGLLAWFNALF